MDGIATTVLDSDTIYWAREMKWTIHEDARKLYTPCSRGYVEDKHAKITIISFVCARVSDEELGHPQPVVVRQT